MQSDENRVSMSINNGSLAQLLSIKQLPTLIRHKTECSPHPWQTPAPVFYPPYRKRLGSIFCSTPKLCPEAFPIKASGKNEAAGAADASRVQVLYAGDRKSVG